MLRTTISTKTSLLKNMNTSYSLLETILYDNSGSSSSSNSKRSMFSFLTNNNNVERKRLSSSSSTTTTTNTNTDTNINNAQQQQQQEQSKEIYEGTFTDTVKRVKMLSYGSLGATIVGCPLLIELSSGAGLEMSSKIVLAGSMSSIGAFTTIMLQWFVSPYVRKLWIDGDTITAEKTSVLLQTYRTKFKLTDMKVAESSHPLVTWEANNGEKFYVEPASISEETYKILQLNRFEPDTSQDAPKGYDDEDDDEDVEQYKKAQQKK